MWYNKAYQIVDRICKRLISSGSTLSISNLLNSIQIQKGVKYKMDKKKLYVGNLPWTMTNDSLKDLFAPYGEISEAIIIMDRYSGRSKGFGFVTFVNDADAEKAAAEMAEKEIEGRKIVVNVARPREDRGTRPGGGAGGYRRDFRKSY